MVVIRNTSNFNQGMSQILRLDLSVWLALKYTCILFSNVFVNPEGLLGYQTVMDFVGRGTVGMRSLWL